jgi:hypothetical protein
VFCVKANDIGFVQICSVGHVAHKWCSQPNLNSGVKLGNLLFSTSLLLSGNNYQKLALFYKFMNIRAPHASFHTRVQAHYTSPAVSQYWCDLQQLAISDLVSKEVVVAGKI